MGKIFIDFSRVSPDQHEVHARLENWADWVRVRPQGWPCSPMFRHYRSKAWQWHEPESRTPVNPLDALGVERVVALLPDKHRTAVRWCYVFRGPVVGAAQALAVSREGLLGLVVDGRSMVKNRLLTPRTSCAYNPPHSLATAQGARSTMEVDLSLHESASA